MEVLLFLIWQKWNSLSIRYKGCRKGFKFSFKVDLQNPLLTVNSPKSKVSDVQDY